MRSSILFEFNGNFNGTSVIGKASLFSNSESGEIQALGKFDSFPKSLHMALSGYCCISHSCSNAAATIGSASNIFQVTKGTYTSIREIEFFSSKGEFLGTLHINGRIYRVNNHTFRSVVSIGGSYKGPSDLKLPAGYELPMNPVYKDDKKDFPYKLDGSFQLKINFEDKENTSVENFIICNHYHRYYFNDGINKDWEKSFMKVNYDLEKSYWDEEEGIMQIVGKSIIIPEYCKEDYK